MWNGPKVALWIAQRTGAEKKVNAQRGWEYLIKAGIAPRSQGRPMPREPTPTRSGRLSKRLPVRLEELKRAHPGAKVKLWAEEEARLGLKPVTRRVWVPVRRPVVRFKRVYEWTYLYGFVQPENGEVFWLVLPSVNVGVFSLTLREFAREVGAGKKSACCWC